MANYEKQVEQEAAYPIPISLYNCYRTVRQEKRGIAICILLIAFLMPHCPVTVVQRYRDGICSLLFHLFFIICHPYIPLHLEEMIFYTSYFSLAFEWYWFRTQKQTGADKNVLSSTVPMSRKRRSLYGLPRPNGTASPYATPQGDSTYVYLKDCRCFGCLSLLVVRAETDKLTGSCAGVNYASKMNVE